MKKKMVAKLGHSDPLTVYESILPMLLARCNEKELKVKPATSFKYFQYLLTKN